MEKETSFFNKTTLGALYRRTAGKNVGIFGMYNPIGFICQTQSGLESGISWPKLKTTLHRCSSTEIYFIQCNMNI